MANLGIERIAFARPVPLSIVPARSPSSSSNAATALPRVPPGASGQTLLANTPRVMALVRAWNGQLAPLIPAALRLPAEPVPPPLTRLLPALFGSGTRVLMPPGVEPLSSRAADSVPLGQSVRAALTERRLRAFEALQDEGQRTLARSSIAASISAYGADALSADELGQAIDLSIRQAQAYRSVAPQGQTPSAAQGTPDAPIADLALLQPAPQPTPDLALPAVPQAPSAPPGTLQQVRSTYDLRRLWPPAPAWSDRQIIDGVNRLAPQLGMAPGWKVQVLQDLLLRPSVTNEQRARDLGMTDLNIAKTVSSVRAALGAPAYANIRSWLAQRIGMPLSALVARIGSGADPELGRCVMSSINPSHRDGVAELLLSTESGSGAEGNTLRMIDTIFRGGDPRVGGMAAAEQLGLPSSVEMGTAMHTLKKLFPGDRIELLRQMGFSFEQILSMNPIGHELSKRFDPALDHYTPEAIAQRQASNLPTTREQAARRLLEAKAGNKTLSYVVWTAIGMLSDRPWLLPDDMNVAMGNAAPNAGPKVGGGAVSRAFGVAEKLLGRKVPRGVRGDLMDRSYRQSINLLLLKVFGLGARRIGSGELQSIPTDYKVGDWPAPTTEPVQPEVRAAPTDQGYEPVHWEQLLPLLQHPRLEPWE